MGTVISDENRCENKIMEMNGEAACVEKSVSMSDTSSILLDDNRVTMGEATRQQYQDTSDKVTECQDTPKTEIANPWNLAIDEKREENGSKQSKDGLESKPITNGLCSKTSENGLESKESVKDFKSEQSENGFDLKVGEVPTSPQHLQLVPYQQLAIVPVTASESVSLTSVTPQQQQPFIVPQPPQTAQPVPPFPYVYMPQPYMHMVYPYPQTTAQIEAPHLQQQQLPQPMMTQQNPPMAPMQYPVPPMWPYYQQAPIMNYAQPSTQQPYQATPEVHINQPTSVLQQQNISPPFASQNLPPATVMSPPGSIQETQMQHAAQMNGNAPQNMLAIQHLPQPGMLQQTQHAVYPYQANLSEGLTHHPTPPTVGAFPCINPPPVSENRSEVRLQGRHHLFTVVPVGSDDLIDAHEEEEDEEEAKPLLPLAKNKQAIISPLRNFIPTLPPIAPTPPMSPVTPICPTMPSPLSVPTLFAVSENKTPDNKNTNTKSESVEEGESSTFTLLEKATTSSSPQKKIYSHYNTVGVTKVATAKHNPYHTVAGPSPVYPKRDYVRVGGLGASPFHPRGEYGVGGLTLPTRKDLDLKALPSNPYHTITGMVSPTYSVREYGIGGRYSPTIGLKEDGRGIPPPLSQREYVKGGIPPSLAGLVLARTNNANARAARNSVKHLSWGYTVSTPHTNKGRSISLRQLNTQRWSTNIPQALTDPTAEEEVSPSLLQHTEPQTNADTSSQPLPSQDAHQLTVRSVGGIEVGSTDGQYMTICGALTSPEQLPFLPSVFRNGHLESCKSAGYASIEIDPRQTWGNKAQFVLACIGYAVGLGNLWRFPYLCYKSGGGAFLIPYFLMLFLCGIPLLLMELAVGQYTRRGPIGALEKLCPIFKGAGVGTVIMSFLLGTYYNVIIAWAIYYLFQSFTSELPWRKCDSAWSVNCFDDWGSNATVPNGTKSATEEYFDLVVLQKSSGMGDMGSFRLELLLALFGAWVLVYFCLWKSVKSSGKVVYVTATLPYLLIGAFLWRAVTLPGATQGLQYFFNPRWELLMDGQVWVAAAAQNFNSIGIAFGSLIAFSSYNKFNNNIVLDTWAISLTNSFTSLLSGMIVFSTLGNIALEQSKDMDEVVAEGPGLVFMVYPQALAKMPYGGIWAVLFFFMLLVLGLDSQFATIEVIITSLQDGFPTWLKKNLKHHEILVLIVCLVSFICGLPNVMQGGIYFFKLIDYYAANISLMYLAFFEVVSIVWVYGAGRLARNVQDMTGRLPSLYFRGCWYIAAPVLILAIWIFSIVDYERPTYNKGEYDYPDWAIGIGWVIASLSIAPIPVFAVIAVYKAKGANLWEKFRNSFKSQIEECSCCGGVFACVAEDQNGDEYPDRQVKLVVYNEGETVEIKKLTLDTDEKKESKETALNGTTN